jgi:hypothetical protein
MNCSSWLELMKNVLREYLEEATKTLLLVEKLESIVSYFVLWPPVGDNDGRVQSHLNRRPKKKS